MIEFDGVSKGYDDRLLIDNLTLSIPPGSIVGVVGPSAGDTLLRLITGQEQPDDGAVRLGQTVVLGYVDRAGPASTRRRRSGGN